MHYVQENCTLKTYQQLERGQSWATGEPVLPCLRTALACAALRAGLPPEGAGIGTAAQDRPAE